MSTWQRILRLVRVWWTYRTHLFCPDCGDVGYKTRGWDHGGSFPVIACSGCQKQLNTIKTGLK